MGIHHPVAAAPSGSRLTKLSPEHQVERALTLTNAYFARQGLYELKANWRTLYEKIWEIGPKQLTLRMG